MSQKLIFKMLLDKEVYSDKAHAFRLDTVTPTTNR